MRDFEDALHVAAARRAGASHVITRNDRDFRGGPIPILSPGDVLALLEAR
jgi:predicted nucleic acid-binding protein